MPRIDLSQHILMKVHLNTLLIGRLTPKHCSRGFPQRRERKRPDCKSADDAHNERTEAEYKPAASSVFAACSLYSFPFCKMHFVFLLIREARMLSDLIQQIHPGVGIWEIAEV